jgi:hypothetical protein
MKRKGRVNDLKYLGYTFNERTTDQRDSEESKQGSVWRLGGRKWVSDFRREMLMFESIIESTLMYGAEIWRWKEEEEVEKVQEKYLKGVLRVERETPGYIVMRECKRNRLRVKKTESGKG